MTIPLNIVGYTYTVIILQIYDNAGFLCVIEPSVEPEESQWGRYYSHSNRLTVDLGPIS